MRAADACRLRPQLAAALNRIVFQTWDGPRGYCLFIPGFFNFASVAEVEASIEAAASRSGRPPAAIPIRRRP